MRCFLKFLFRLCLLAALAVGFWYYENNTVQTEVFTVSSDTLPAAFDGFRIASITDLHGRSFDGDRLLRAVRGAQPDIIVLVGDIVDQESNPAMVAPLCSALTAVAPTFYVTGNHEWARSDLKALLNTMTEAGVTVLANDYRTLELGDARIVLAGIHDPNASVVKTAPEDLTARIREAYPDEYLIVLNHRNDALERWAELGADLVISGHGHGGVIRIPGIGGLVGTDRSLFPDYDAGLYALGKTTMAVSRGLGFIGLPFRLFNRPELMILELEAAS